MTLLNPCPNCGQTHSSMRSCHKVRSLDAFDLGVAQDVAAAPAKMPTADQLISGEATCVLTDAPGEDADDCTTHAHEFSPRS